MYVHLCVHYTGNALVGHSMSRDVQFQVDKQTRRDRRNNLLKCPVLRNLMFFD